MITHPISGQFQATTRPGMSKKKCRWDYGNINISPACEVESYLPHQDVLMMALVLW